MCVFIGLILLSADWWNLAREIFQQNEKPDLLSGGAKFWFHPHRWERRSPGRRDDKT
jgi:hypothetical protein